MILSTREASTKICPLMSQQFQSPEEAAKWDPLKTGAVGYCGA